MITKKKIGKIQIALGLILFCIVVVSSIFIIKEVYIGGLIVGVTGIAKGWADVANQINGTTIGLTGHVVSDVIHQSQIIKANGYVFLMCAFTLVVLSMILFLQGLANIAKK